MPPKAENSGDIELQTKEAPSTAFNGDLEPDRIPEGPRTVANDSETKRIMRKLDFRLLPVFATLYLFSFIDRGAIGNARVAGMNQDLNLTYSEYTMALCFFFVTYGLFEVPSNLLMKKFGAKVWLPIITVLWGLIMTFTGLITNFQGLLAMRILLGFFETGLFCGVTTLLSFIYPRAFIQVRFGIFYVAATVAGAFSGLLAYGLARVHVGSYEGWRWIFIVEGLCTVVLGIGAYFVLISSLEEANFLTAKEKQYMEDRLRYDGSDIPMNDEYQHKFVIAALTDWKTWIALLACIAGVCPLGSVAITLPYILKASLGYSAIDSQLMTVPIYACAAVFTLIFAYLSDRYQRRTLFFCLGVTISAIGWAMSIGSHSAHVRYAACFIMATGSYAGFPSIFIILSQNVGGKTKRSTALAVQIGIGGLTGIISSQLFPPKDAPRFLTGYWVNFASNIMALAAATLNFALLYLANKKKQAEIDSGQAAMYSRQELADMGDACPYFRYRY
ncbi:unnamed protein product [Sympodiomycopsis kandeliae]